jgi:hypothetical protein
MSGYADVVNVNRTLWACNGGTLTNGASINLGTTVYFAAQAPTAVNGGGVTVLAGYACSSIAMAAGSSPLVRLLKYSSAATPVVNGTIAVAVGGSASAWTANVPKTFTISSAFVNAGEYIAVELAGTCSYFLAGTTNDQLYVNLQYVMGY